MAVRFAVYLAQSLDGYIARADGSLDWLDPYGEDTGYLEFFASVDALVIGRGTYDTARGFPEWPYGKKRVIVCTRRPAEPAHGEEIWTGTPRALADRLEREGVGRVYLDGGALIRGFLQDGVRVDELNLHVIPIILGAGVPLFASGLPEVPLRLVEAKAYPSGLVQLRYAARDSG
jgi:dihydrofolate reductase